MLQPKRTKFRKMFKGRNRGLRRRATKVSFGEFGLKAADRGRITARQIEAARRAMTRHIKRGGKVWIRVFPDKPISKKPAKSAWVKVRATSSTGSPNPARHHALRDGRCGEDVAREAFRLAAAKLPVKTTFVARTVM